jgi:hypothetical protein
MSFGKSKKLVFIIIFNHPISIYSLNNIKYKCYKMYIKIVYQEL